MAVMTKDAQFWHRAAAKYAAGPIADIEGYETSVQRLRDCLTARDRVLEIGCGTGTTALKIAPSVAEITATDVAPGMIQIAREKAAAQGCHNIRFEIAAPETAGWPAACFDAAFGMNVLHLIEEREAALRAVHYALRTGALFITKTPCLKEMTPLIRLAVPVMQMVGKAPYVSFLSAADLERDLTAAGFEIIERARHGTRGKDIRPFLIARKR